MFGVSRVEEVAADLGVKVLGKMPIDPELAKMVETEKFYEVNNVYLQEAVEVLK